LFANCYLVDDFGERKFSWKTKERITNYSVMKPGMNYLVNALQSGGFALTGVALLVALGCAGWTLIHRDEKVVQQSQPTFLYIFLIESIASELFKGNADMTAISGENKQFY
jgi:hypothetical protein